jgi:hypothetical protein
LREAVSNSRAELTPSPSKTATPRQRSIVQKMSSASKAATVKSSRSIGSPSSVQHDLINEFEQQSRA